MRCLDRGSKEARRERLVTYQQMLSYSKIELKELDGMTRGPFCRRPPAPHVLVHRSISPLRRATIMHASRSVFEPGSTVWTLRAAWRIIGLSNPNREVMAVIRDESCISAAFPCPYWVRRFCQPNPREELKAHGTRPSPVITSPYASAVA